MVVGGSVGFGVVVDGASVGHGSGVPLPAVVDSAPPFRHPALSGQSHTFSSGLK